MARLSKFLRKIAGGLAHAQTTCLPHANQPSMKDDANALLLSTLQLLQENAVLLCESYGRLGIPVTVVIGNDDAQMVVAPQDNAEAAKMLYRAADDAVNRMPAPSEMKH